MSKTLISQGILHPPLSPHPHSSLFCYRKQSARSSMVCLCWLFLIAFLSFVCLEADVFPALSRDWGDADRPVVLLVLLLAFLKISIISAFFQLLGIYPDCVHFSYIMATQSHQPTLLAPWNESHPAPGIWINTSSFADESLTSYFPTVYCPFLSQTVEVRAEVWKQAFPYCLSVGCLPHSSVDLHFPWTSFCCWHCLQKPFLFPFA